MYRSVIQVRVAVCEKEFFAEVMAEVTSSQARESQGQKKKGKRHRYLR